MGLNKYRNKPCQCGSGIKFKYCCLQDHYKQQARLVTNLTKKVQEKTAKYFQKRYKKITSIGQGPVREKGQFDPAEMFDSPIG